MKIALFTPFSPDAGAGSVLIKSLLPELHGLEIRWYYLASSEASSIKGIWLGRNFSPFTLINNLATLSAFGAVAGSIVKKIISQMQADVYWVVTQDEGVCVAAELIKAGKRLHLAIHDDPAALFGRSRKYKYFQWLISSVFSKVIRMAASVDVICPAMGNKFQALYAVKSFAVYRYVPSLPDVLFTPIAGRLRIGHIGSLYQSRVFGLFVEACHSYALKEGMALEFVYIGRSPNMERVASQYPLLFEPAGHLAEEDDAIRLLAACDFVYAMYPFDTTFKLFRQTSFPLKVSTYIQAQRPIFAHCPSDSTLASAVSGYSVGEVCSSDRRDDIEVAVDRILSRTVDRSRFEYFRANVLGKVQIEKLRKALGE